MKKSSMLVVIVVILSTVIPVRSAASPARRLVEAEEASLTTAGPANAAADDLFAALAPYLDAHDRPPIVLVHGWQGVNFDKPDCERGSVAWADENWDHLDEELEALGFHVEFARLRSGSSFDEPNCTPVAEENAPYVAEAIDLARASTGAEKVILIAHSMGGLVSRAYLESNLYRDDVVAIYTLGSPHVGVPVDVLAELVEIITFGAITLEEYCVAQPVVCQFSDDESANPPGFTGIETFNDVHNTRAAGVYYHMIGGDIGFDHRAWIAELLYQLIPGPNDGIVPLPSAMGVSSATGNLGPLSGVIDRLEVYAAHIDSFCDDPSVPLTCDHHYNYHDRDRYCMDWDLSVYEDELFRSSSFYGCLEPTLNNRLPDHVCGVASELTVAPPTPLQPPLRQRLPVGEQVLAPGQRAVHAVGLPGGPAMLLAYAPLQAQEGTLRASLVAPDGRTIDPAYAAGHPDQVRYKGDSRAALYLLRDAMPGEWQVMVEVVDAPPGGLAYRAAAFQVTGEFDMDSDTATAPVSRSAAGTLPAAGPIAPDMHLSPHECTIDHGGPYVPGDSVAVTCQLQMLEEGNYREWFDHYFFDGPNGWDVQTQSAPPYADLGGWGRDVVAVGCDDTALAYWGIDDPFLAPLDSACELGLLNRPASGSFNGPWARWEPYAATAVESFEGSFPPAGWTIYKPGGGSDNHGFQQTSSRAHSGSYSAYHDDDDPWFWDPIETWFVMPQHAVQAGDALVFWQNQNYGDWYSYHGVWISSGSPDPDDGDYWEMAELGPGQEDAWEEVRIGLSHYSGKNVHLAFVYEGDYSDEWYLDDVYVERQRLQATTFDFAVDFVVSRDPEYLCPGSNYVGVTAWYSDTRAGLVGVALGDLVGATANAAPLDVSQPCPLPAIVVTQTVAVDGACPGSDSLEVPENAQEVTFCFAVRNEAPVTVTQHLLHVPALGGDLFSGTVTLGPGESYAFQQDWDLGGAAGECFPITATWTAQTPRGFGQPQGEDADVPFIYTVYESQDSDGAEVCIAAPLLVDFERPAYAVGEGDGSAAIDVRLSAASPRPVAVHYATADGTARAGDDYLAAAGLLTFTPGVTLQLFAVSVISDALDEADETLALILSDAVNADVGANSPAELTIVDDDPLPLLHFAAPACQVDEGASAATVTVSLETASGLTVTVDYAASDGTARGGSDYVPVSGTLTFAPGVTQQAFVVPLLDDALDELDETVRLALADACNAEVGGNNPITLTITDDDPPPTVDYDRADYTALEESGAVTVTVVLSLPSALTVTVDYAASDGTAQAGEDYLPLSGTLTFAPGVTAQSFAVTLVDDRLPEGPETVVLTLSGADNATIGGNNPALLTIVEGDRRVFVPWVLREFER
ncbi:MAG: alpha/beta fold hydrolase [Anaerolineae bacterium]|nr:alpha/beta fold hydrolase [Anaerolineae bacterium]